VYFPFPFQQESKVKPLSGFVNICKEIPPVMIDYRKPAGIFGRSRIRDH